MITRHLYSFLSSRTAINDMADTIQLWPLDQEANLPAITYQQDNEERQHDFDGPDGLISASIQLDCWAKAASDAQNIAQVVVDDLDGYRGLIGSRYCDLLKIDRMIDLFEADTEYHRVSIGLTLWHRGN